MNFLLDEQLNEAVAPIMSTVGAKAGHSFQHIDKIKPVMPSGEGFPDDRIPSLCEEHSMAVLVSANYKDFGAKKALYEALLTTGVHVIVLRPGKVRFTLPQQVHLITGAWERILALLRDAAGPVLIRVTPTGAEVRSVDDLLAEIDRGGRRSLP